MTPSEQWVLGLFAVYAVPSFFLGVGLTLLVTHIRSRRRGGGAISRLLTPEQVFAPSDGKAENLPPRDKMQLAI
jgi:hypothetical protein